MKNRPKVDYIEENKRRHRAIEKENNFLKEDVLGNDEYIKNDSSDSESIKTNIEKAIDKDVP